MALLSYGTMLGLAYKHDFYKDYMIKLKMEELDQRAAIQQMAEAKILGEAMKKTKAKNPYYASKLNELSQKIIEQAGAMISSGALRTPQGYAEFINTVNQLTDNEWVQRDMHLTENLELLRKAALANPNIAKTASYQQQLQEAENERMYGTIDPLSDIEPRPYVFRALPPWVDLTKVFYEAGSKFDDMILQPIESEPGSGYYHGAFIEIPRPESLAAVAKQIYTAHKEQIDVEAEANKMDPLKYTIDQINSYIKRSHSTGSPSSTLGRGRGQNTVNAWVLDVVMKRATDVPISVYEEVFGDRTDIVVMKRTLEGDEPLYTYIPATDIMEFTWGTGVPQLIGDPRLPYTTYEPNTIEIPADGNQKKTRAVRVSAIISKKNAEALGLIKGDRVLDKYRDSVQFTNIDVKSGDEIKSLEAVRVSGYKPFDINNNALAAAYQRFIQKSNTGTGIYTDPNIQTEVNAREIVFDNGSKLYIAEGPNGTVVVIDPTTAEQLMSGTPDKVNAYLADEANKRRRTRNE